MDTKFSVAVHILILISEAPNPLNSDQIAGSVVGRHIRPMLTEMFEGIEESFARELSQRTLADCTRAIRSKMSQTV